MSTKDNASDAPGRGMAALRRARLAEPIALKNIYDKKFIANLKERATSWKETLTAKLKTEIFETENERHKKFLDKSGIRARWEERLEETEDFENLDIGTLQGVVALHSDYTQYNKDMKQIDVFEKKMAVRVSKEEMKKSTEEMNEATQRLGEIIPEAAELMQKVGELREKINGLHETIENLDKELYEARESRKDEDRHLVKKLKEYIAEMRVLEPPQSAPESEIPPATPSDIDSDLSEQRIPEKPPKKAGKKAATVEDATD
ncbi:hypothetical protein ACEPAH_2989 [Sanghuangporus vaninii]